ncbi:MAG: DUF4124 domain-containing protein [Burkholderiaceae bacterium]|jgi:hypothetical protein|nr:DUF4124 domain-containing protein [Burkholderiaceae bacterium]
MKYTARCLLLGTALLAGLPALAQYSWIDGAGHKVFSDQPPPPNIPPKNILSGNAVPAAPEAPAPPASALVPAASAPAAVASAASGQDKALEEKKKAADATATAKQQAAQQKLAAQRADNCQRAKIALAGLQSGARVAQFDAKGQRSYMTDAQRTAEIQHVQGVIDSDCH